MISTRLRWLALLGVSCTTANLRFTRNGDAVAETKVLNATQYIPSDQDIAGAIATCADELTTELAAPALAKTKVSAAPRTELHLYARAPSEMSAFLSGLRDADVVTSIRSATPTDLAEGRWDPKTAASAGFPDVLTVLSPAVIGGSGTTTRALSTTAFFSRGIAAGLPAAVATCHPNSNQGATKPGAAVKTAIVYNRGTCRQEIALDGLLKEGVTELVDGLHANLHLGIGSNQVKYAVLQSMVTASAGISEPTQNLFLFLHYIARDLAGNAPSDVAGAVRYDFQLDGNGRVSVQPFELRWSFGGIWGPLSSNGAIGQEGWHHAFTSRDGTVVKRVNDKILEKQLLGVKSALVGVALAGGNFDCDDRSFIQQCGKAAAEIVAPLVKNGAAGRFTPAEVQHLACAVGDPSSCAAIGVDGAAQLRARWTCTASSASRQFGQGQRYCDMVVPVERLIAMPDALGAVLFERDDIDNAAYALQVGTGAACEADTNNVPANRKFVAAAFTEER
jgi:hypothetical protein